VLNRELAVAPLNSLSEAQTLLAMGSVYQRRGDFPSAFKVAGRAFSICQDLDPSTGHAEGGTAIMLLAELHYETGAHYQCINLMHSFMSQQHCELDAGDFCDVEGTLRALVVLSHAYEKNGMLHDAEDACRQEIDLRTRFPVDGKDVHIGRARCLMGDIQKQLGQDEEAEISRAVGLHLGGGKALGKSALETEALQIGLDGIRDGDVAALERSMDLQCTIHGKRHPAIAHMLRAIGKLHRVDRRFLAAEDCLEAALQIYVRAYGPTHLEVAATQFALGKLCRDLGDLDSAESRMRCAVHTVVRCGGVRHPVAAQYQLFLLDVIVLRLLHQVAPFEMGTTKAGIIRVDDSITRTHTSLGITKWELLKTSNPTRKFVSELRD
jgi:tetratricopeptide (TPR) repeat protein